jgi:FkbM family methyltransferase
MAFSLRRYLLATLSQRECAVTPAEWKRLRFTYAQHGEDIIAEALLPEARGFYVEVGAFHPVSISNTYLFYRKGWRGIVVDPAPPVARLYRRRRPKDTVLACAASEEEGVRTFEVMRAGETSRLQGSKPLTPSAQQPTQSIQVSCRRLASILGEHLPAGQTIDFLTVDAEGHDLSVLRSNDWQKYRPRLVAVEDPLPAAQSPIHRFLAAQGYHPVITAKITRFYQPLNGSNGGS